MGCLGFDPRFVESSILMNQILYSLSLQDASADAGSSSVPPTIDMLALARINEAGAKTISFLPA